MINSDNENLTLKEVSSCITSVIWKANANENLNFSETYISPFADELLDLPPNTIGNSWEKYFSFINPPDLDKVKETLRNGINNLGEIVILEYQMITGNGKKIWIQSQGRCFKKNGQIKVFGHSINITKQKENEIELLKYKNNLEIKAKQYEKKFHLFADNIPGVSFIKDKDLRYTFINKEFEKVFNVKLSEWKGKTNRELKFYPQEIIDELEKNDKTIIADRKPIKIIENVPVNNKIHNWLVVKFPLLNYNNNFCSIAGIAIDITKRIETEQKLEEQNKALIIATEKATESDRLKTAFLNNLSHEIRTPLNHILGFSDILLKNKQKPVEKITHFLNIINQGGNRLLKIIDDIIEISKIETNQIKINKTEFSVNKLLEEIRKYFDNNNEITQKKLNFNKINDFPNTKITADYDKLLKIFVHLIENAVKYTENGQIEYGYKQIDNKLTFFVSDTGIGILAENQEFIFKAFRQADERIEKNFEGSGLGLAISKAVVELHGGKIWLKSDINKGTTFYFTIN